jgi:hypothetical protein
MTDTTERSADSPAQPLSGSAGEMPSRSVWRRIWDITNHGTVAQVVGGAILTGMLLVVGSVWAVVSTGDNRSSPSARMSTAPSASPSSQPVAPPISTLESPDPTASSSTSIPATFEPVFTGRLVVGGHKEIDTVPPRSLDAFVTGDLYFNSFGDDIQAEGGASLGIFTGTGAPTLAQCEQTAQAEGTTDTPIEPQRGDWLCVGTESGSVLAWKITRVDESYLEGDATIWHVE